MPRNPASSKQESVPTVLRPRRVLSPTPEEVRVRAYQIYLARGAQAGREAEDWAQAERELQATQVIVR